MRLKTFVRISRNCRGSIRKCTARIRSWKLEFEAHLLPQHREVLTSACQVNKEVSCDSNCLHRLCERGQIREVVDRRRLHIELVQVHQSAFYLLPDLLNSLDVEEVNALKEERIQPLFGVPLLEQCTQVQKLALRRKQINEFKSTVWTEQHKSG
jgi:hypothetical protein